MNKSLFLSMLLISVLLISGCGKSGTTDGNKDNGAVAVEKGTLVMQITDAPAALNIQKAEVTISGIQVHQGEVGDTTGAWENIVTGPKTFDLVAIKDVTALIGSADIPVGKYTQVRLSVDKATAVIDGNTVEMLVPSKEVRLVRGFEIVAGETTKLTLDFKAGLSINDIGGGKYVMKPVIKILQG